MLVKYSRGKRLLPCRYLSLYNTVNLPPSFAKEICRQLVEADLDISWRCILYPWKMDEELVKWMAKAGCKLVALGFESGFREILRAMNKRSDPMEARRISDMLTDYGIHRMGLLLLGGLVETKESAEESFDYVDCLNLEMVKVTVGLRIYPNTTLAKTAVAEGMITAYDDLLQPRFYLARGLEE